MTQLKTRLVAAASALLMVVACSIGFSNPSSAASSSGGSKTYTIGILTDITGAGSTIGGTFPLGVKAGIGLAKHSGYTIKYVVADTATTPAGALAGAQKLVEQNHVFAVFLTSVLGFAAAPYLLSQGIPVYGGAIDGSEWITDRNMFSVLGYQNYNTVPSIWGTFAKLEGVTNLASVGYGIEPSSAQAAKAYAVSAAHVGIKTGYLNTNFPLGSTNVAPIVLQMKQAGINGLYTGIATSSTFAIIAGLEQQGVKLKAGVPPSGYGGDLVQGGPDASKQAQGLFFVSGWEPVEMHTAATITLQGALKTYAGVKGDPTFGEYIGYLSVDAFVQGLKKAGANPTQASLINAMLKITHYAGLGLWGGHSIGFNMSYRGTAFGADNCSWFTKYVGKKFLLVAGASPLCGYIIPGVTVSP